MLSPERKESARNCTTGRGEILRKENAALTGVSGLGRGKEKHSQRKAYSQDLSKNFVGFIDLFIFH